MSRDATFSAEAVRSTVAVGGTAASVLTLNEWVMLATLAYIVIQVVYLLRKWWREEQAHSKQEGCKDER